MRSTKGRVGGSKRGRDVDVQEDLGGRGGVKVATSPHRLYQLPLI